jgi:Domain of unknown function (DUF4394)
MSAIFSPALEVTMFNALLRQGIRAIALASLGLTALGIGTGCGGSGSGVTEPPPSDPGPSDPGPSNPGPSDPGPMPGPAPVGDVIYAVDLSNNFLVFGSGSLNVLTQKIRITGLPILKRIIGLAIRQSDGKLYGVGNDSRVYTIDPTTAVATPVGPGFSPKIASFFDIHFAMALEPNGERVRLIAAESGGNWSISLADGTATLMKNARYAEGTGLAGKTPRLLGIAFAPYPATAAASVTALSAPRPCENLMYAMDIDEALMVAACDPDTGDFWPVGGFPYEGFERCGELMPGPDGMTRPEGEEGPPPNGELWHPRAPDTPFWIFVNKLGEAQNKVGTFTAAKSMLPTWQAEVPSPEPIQSAVWAKGGLYGPSRTSPYQLVRHAEQSVAQGQGPSPSVAQTRTSDPRAHCGTGH